MLFLDGYGFDNICNGFCDKTFLSHYCELQNGSTITAACFCRGDWGRNQKKYHGGCRYWRDNPTGNQRHCQKECEDAGFEGHVIINSNIKEHGYSETISENEACKIGCKISGKFLLLFTGTKPSQYYKC